MHFRVNRPEKKNETFSGRVGILRLAGLASGGRPGSNEVSCCSVFCFGQKGQNRCYRKILNMSAMWAVPGQRHSPKRKHLDGMFEMLTFV